MIYTKEVENMCPVAKGAKHEPAPIPEEGKWVHSKKIEDISGFTHGVGWCAPQQGACKLSLNVKNGVIEEALVETIGCSGMTHSAAMAAEILQGKTILEALNTDLVCDAINTAMRELFLQIVYGRTQSAFSDDGLAVGAGLEDLGKGLRSQVGTMYATKANIPNFPKNLFIVIPLYYFVIYYFHSVQWQSPASQVHAEESAIQTKDCRPLFSGCFHLSHFVPAAYVQNLYPNVSSPANGILP